MPIHRGNWDGVHVVFVVVHYLFQRNCWSVWDHNWGAIGLRISAMFMETKSECVFHDVWDIGGSNASDHDATTTTIINKRTRQCNVRSRWRAQFSQKCSASSSRSYWGSDTIFCVTAMHIVCAYGCNRCGTPTTTLSQRTQMTPSNLDPVGKHGQCRMSPAAST